jgi:RNA recognition motif-containing protein
VKGFGKHWTHKDLYDAFSQFGQILSARCSIDQDHTSRGFGYVQFRNADEATKAC